LNNLVRRKNSRHFYACAMLQPTRLHLLCGKAGAGKSSLATALATDRRAILTSEAESFSSVTEQRAKRRPI